MRKNKLKTCPHFRNVVRCTCPNEVCLVVRGAKDKSPKEETAVDWLVDRVTVRFIDFENVNEEEWIDTVREAREMQKREKILDYEMGYINGCLRKEITGEQYYDDTYGPDPSPQNR